jgi:predicted RNA-binding protein with PIN domain
MYVIDGYNLLHALARHPGVLPSDGDRSRARLVQLLGELARRESTNVRIFFDGVPSNVGTGDLDYPRVRVVFCGPVRESADDAVREFVENSADPRKLRVVSADHQVINACRLSGARIVHSREMSERLAGFTPPETERSIPDKPTSGGGKLEKEMLEEIGDWEEFQRDVEEDLP